MLTIPAVHWASPGAPGTEAERKDRFRRVSAWLTANGIDLHDVIEGPVTVDGDEIRVQLFVRGEDGFRIPLRGENRYDRREAVYPLIAHPSTFDLA